jgi:hypothetical protein
MSDHVESPPAWASTIFYLLIIIVLVMCIVAFILEASCIFTEPNKRSINYSIVTFGVGVSLICGILWVGGVTGVVNISKETQKTLWAVLIAGVLSVTVTAYKGFFSTAGVYKVTGTVIKTDGKDPRDISISDRIPPLTPVPGLKEDNIAFEVREESGGVLPKLLFLHPAYNGKPINLNDRTKVALRNGELIILESVKLDPGPSNGR